MLMQTIVCMLLFLVGLILGAILLFFYADEYRKQRKKTLYIVDFDRLADLEPVIKRAILYENNHPNKEVFDRYITEHVLIGQELNSNLLTKVLKLQNKNYSLCFVTIRPEFLRIPSVAFLEAWGLKGSLYMYNGKATTKEVFANQHSVKRALIDYAISIEKKNYEIKFL